MVAASSRGQANGSSISPAQDGKGYVLHVTTREVVVEVVARDRDNHPVVDLDESDFEVFEGSHKEDAQQRQILGFRVVDPDVDEGAGAARAGAVVLPLGGRCEIRSTIHYEIAFRPASWSSGIHAIRLTSKRKHVSLSYRSEFYVGVSDAVQMPLQKTAAQIDSDLAKAACYHSDVPSSILLGVTKAESKPGEAGYVITIGPDSLAMAGVEEDSTQLQLQYGICTFSRSGRVLGFWESSVNKTMDAGTLSSIFETGWREKINVPERGSPALMRLVVREPRSGNLGTVDLADEVRRSAKNRSVPVNSERQPLVMQSADLEDESEHVGSRHALGSPVPAKGALCGDVYELPRTTEFLPSDFRRLNAVGAIFTDSLNIPERNLPQGMPGSTPRSEWFGVDYYGEFWVTTPGKYEFVLSADDGADLYIDDRRVISDDGIHPPQTVNGSVTLGAGRHTIHLPYFQGPTYVSLVLQVKPPNGILDVFDIRDYMRPR